uniref:Uncharacterized protein n=1 Tax=Romanomermis culicivorax TaxID=13658 RepID=A0A915KW50_ROMCU
MRLDEASFLEILDIIGNCAISFRFSQLKFRNQHQVKVFNPWLLSTTFGSHFQSENDCTE